MKDKVKAFIESHALLRQGDTVTVGLSGGADSVALLCVLLELAEEMRLTVRACHVNHCLRGEESDGDEAFCRALCEARGVPLIACRRDVPAYCAAQGCSAEEGARILRYQALEEAADGSLIATAHHLGDNAETVLFNLLRGTALDGLCGIPVRRGNVIRPLLGVTREEIEAYLRAFDQPWRNDSTNFSDDAVRNRLRHEAIPVLTALNPAFFHTVGRMTESLSADRAVLDALVGEWYEQNAAGGFFPRDAYAALPDALRLRALRRLLRANGVSIDRRRLVACDALLRAGEGSRCVGKDLVFRAEQSGGRIVSLQTPPFLPRTPVDFACLPQKIVLSPGKFLEIRMLSHQERKFFVNNRNGQYQNCIDCDTISYPLAVRGRCAGDKLRPVGRGCTKSLKKLLAERKIPAERRGAVAVLDCGGEPVWVEGFGVRESSSLTGRTQAAMLLTITHKEI